MKEEEAKMTEKIELQPALRLLEPEETLSDRKEARQQLLRDKWKLYFYENGRYVSVLLGLLIKHFRFRVHHPDFLCSP